MKIQEMNEIVGEKIKNLRKSRNLSQEEVAEFIHVSQSTYAGYILPLCELFGIQPEELLKTDHIVINNNNTSCENAGNAYVFNQLSDKLIEQYEKRLAEKDSFISYLQKELEELKKGMIGNRS